MGQENEYTASLTSDRFLFREMRITAELFSEGLTLEKAIQKVEDEQLFQYPGKTKYGRMTRLCWKRLTALDDMNLVKLIADGSLQESKQIVLYSIMKSNRLVRDFMLEVIADKYETQNISISRVDSRKYLTEVQNRSESAAAWKDETVSRLSMLLLRFLESAGFMDSVSSKSLNQVRISNELKHHLIKERDTGTLHAFNCFE